MTWTDGPVTVHLGDCLDALHGMPEASVHCAVTSPPYWGLRDYKTSPVEWADGWVGSLGLEPTPEMYVGHVVEVFQAVRRVLRPDGVVWLNLGDSYIHTSAQPDRSTASTLSAWRNGGRRDGAATSGAPARGLGDLKPKDLGMIPARVALALQADGWWLRQDVVWAKPNPMPESVTDRPTTSHEHVLLLARSEAYFYDAEAVREAATWNRDNNADWQYRRAERNGHKHPSNRNARSGGFTGWRTERGRNLRSVWTIATQPYAAAHFATFPEELARRCIAAGTSERGCCPECGAPWRRVTGRSCGRCGAFISTQGKSCPACGHVNDWKAERGISEAFTTIDWSTPGRGTPRKLGASGKQGSVPRQELVDNGWEPGCAHGHDPVPAVVLDPFAGSGTTLAVARRMGRRAVGIELQPDYLPLIQQRVREGGLPLLEAETKSEHPDAQLPLLGTEL